MKFSYLAVLALVATNAFAADVYKDVFQAAGLDPETPPATWDDLVSIAQKATKAPDRYGFGLIAGDPGNTFFRVATFLWANGGDVLCVSNFPDAMLDLPVNSPQEDADRLYEAFTERIPMEGTAVTVIFEPELPKK